MVNDIRYALRVYGPPGLRAHRAANAAERHRREHGGVGTAALSGTLRSMLFEVTPSDPEMVAATAAAVRAVTAVGSLVAARRVMRVDPTIAHRTE
jgi:hypothetical protein